MPSFDIVSTINMQELDNAVNQAQKELATRYDFRGSKSTIDWDKKTIKLTSDDDFKMKALVDIVVTKALKRGVDIKALDVGKTEPAGGSLVRCEIKPKEGVPQETAKAIVKDIKAADLKVQAQIQENQVRVTGKKRDDLQTAIAAVRAKDYGLPLQFVNFRD